MKKHLKFTLLGLLGFFTVIQIFAQTPERIKYQAVLRDAAGNVQPLTGATVIIDILQGSATGPSVYRETQTITTTAQGVLNLNIGGGTVNLGNFTTINWATSTYWVKVTVNGTVITTGQLFSVPYALNVKGINLNPANGNIGIGTTNPQNKLHVAGFVQLEGNPDAQVVFGTSGTNGKRGIGSLAGWDANTLYINGWGDFTGGVSIGHIGGSETSKLSVRGQVQIVDGTQGAGKLLRSDASGNASWITVAGNTPAVTAVFPGTSTSAWTSMSPIYTGTTLTLPPGKWSVQISILLANSGTCESWVRSSLTDSPTSSSSSGDIIGASLASGYKAYKSSWGMVIGTIIINNTSGGNKTYYYWGETCENYTGSFSMNNFGRGVAMEDQIIAYPMN